MNCANQVFSQIGKSQTTLEREVGQKLGPEREGLKHIDA